jgi:regulator of protease activity HflC (stomatin/prohibitin superfamily)
VPPCRGIQTLLGAIGPLIFLAAVVIWFFSATVKVVQEYERGVVFRLGRLVGARGPGLILLIPKIERMVKVDLRVITLDVPAQEAITRDNVTVKVSAVAYFRSSARSSRSCRCSTTAARRR